MRRLNLNYVTLFTAFTATFLSGYFIRDLGIGQQSADPAKSGQFYTLAANGSHSSQPKIPNIAKYNKIVQLTQSSLAHNTPNPRNSSAQPVNEIGDNRSVSELLAAMEAHVAQDQTYEELRDGDEFHLLLSRLESDPATRIQVSEQLMRSIGTPLSQIFGQALAMSGGAIATPEIKAVAAQLLRDGSVEQRLNVLQMLGQVNYDAQIHTMALDVLRKDSLENPRLAVAAMSTLNRQDLATQVEYQEVVSSVLPFIHSPDPQVRQSSLQVLSQWAGRDQAALQTFIEATHDADPEVRSLAITTLGQGGFAYSSVRDTLLSTLQNPNEDPSVIAATQQALKEFPLDEQALSIYQANTNVTE
ncbi:MAG: HEAT repeat domain-containing protein [Methylococcaceae bacterium]|nr:HEAT repeat domain-containing protein [Methylococcaceae bacterium]